MQIMRRKYETAEQRDRRQEQEGQSYSDLCDRIEAEDPDLTKAEIHAEACRRLDAIAANRAQEAVEDQISLRMCGL